VFVCCCFLKIGRGIRPQKLGQEIFLEKQKISREIIDSGRNCMEQKLTKEREVSFAFGVFIKKKSFSQQMIDKQCCDKFLLN
jgi:hypothetical protein